jgi:hypothetical protein
MKVTQLKPNLQFPENNPYLPLLNLTLVGDACFKPEAPRAAAAGATAATETLATLDMTNAIPMMNYPKKR